MILVLEASTASAKAMVYCPNRGALSLVSEPYGKNESNVATQDADVVIAKILQAGKKAAQGHEIDAISISGIWHSVLLCDHKMVPASAAYSWADISASPLTARLRKDENFVDTLYNRSGCMVHAMYALYKLMYMKEKGVRLDDKYVFSQGSYLFYLLTGQRLTTDSIVAGSALLDINTKQYAKDSLQLAGIVEDQLPRLTTYHETHPLTAKAASWLGVRQGIPVLPPYPDGALNQIGASSLLPGIMTLSVGTSGALRVISDKPVLPKNHSTWCYVAPDCWISGGATASATNCVDWLMQNVFGGHSTYEEMEKLVIPDKNNPYFLPFLAGERCPGWQDERRSNFWRLGGNHGQPAMYYAVLEGVLFNLLQCYEEIAALNGSPRIIRVSGGICKSPFWLQMLADIWQREVLVSNLEQTSMVGAAVLGLCALGKLASPADFQQPQDIPVHHNPQMAQYYEERFAVWLEGYSQMG